MQTLPEHTSKTGTRLQDKPVTTRRDEDQDTNSEVEIKRKPVKRSSKRLKSKMPTVQVCFNRILQPSNFN